MRSEELEKIYTRKIKKEHGGNFDVSILAEKLDPEIEQSLPDWIKKLRDMISRNKRIER